MKQLIAFDLDGTLAESKAPLDDDIAGLLATLLTFAQVAVISGGDWPQLKKQVIDRLPSNAELAMLWILPTAGAKLFRFTKDWQLVYSQAITPDEKSHILGALERAIPAAGLNDDPAWGPPVEDRGTQITYSGIGQKAPLDAKRAWDPDRRKRLQLQAMLEQSLPGWSINIGGTTSVDITREGIDKGFGLRKLAEVSGVALKDMMFLGDAVFPGGNDYPAVTTGVDTVAVRDVQETKSILHALTLWFGA